MNKITLVLVSVISAFCLNACKNGTGANIKPFAGETLKLVELNGSPVEEGQSPIFPHIVLDMNTYKLSGSAGCNRIMGAFQLKKSGKITFAPVASTQMMCLDMELENQFIKIFDSIDGYTAKDNILTFIDGSGTPLARFILDSSR